MPDLDIDADEEERVPVFGGSRQGIFTDFLNPLTGQKVETRRDEIDVDLDTPVLLGFEDTAE